MHRPAAVDSAPSPAKKGECAHTATRRPYSAFTGAPVSSSTRSVLDIVRVLCKQHNHLQQCLVYSSIQLDEGRPHGAWVLLGWWELPWLAPAAYSSSSICSVSSDCPAYGVVAATAVSMVSCLAWTCLGYSRC